MSKSKKQTKTEAAGKNKRPAASEPTRARKTEANMVDQDDTVIALKGQVEELTEANEELAKENKRLNEELAEAEEKRIIQAQPAPPGGVRQWVRGILPGERYIKTNTKTGQVVTIDRDEWNQTT